MSPAARSVGGGALTHRRGLLAPDSRLASSAFPVRAMLTVPFPFTRDVTLRKRCVRAGTRPDRPATLPVRGALRYVIRRSFQLALVARAVKPGEALRVKTSRDAEVTGASMPVTLKRR